MATKQELEQENIELKRQVSELTDELKTLSSSAPATQTMADETVLEALREEVRRLTDAKDKALLRETELGFRVVELMKNVEDLTAEVERLRLLDEQEPQAGVGSYQPDHELLQAWELVERVKIQFVPADARVILLKD